jgi:Family of unknown function (DUF5343)
MGIDIEGTAPYAPAENVLAVIRRFREKGLPEVLNAQELVRLSVAEGNATRVLRALRFLGLLDIDGRRTPVFDRLARASTVEYPELLAEIFREAYKDVFMIVDPAETNATELDDAFRHYEPQAQRERMVRLFLGLCREANLLPGGPLEPGHRVKTGINGKSPGSPPNCRARLTSSKTKLENEKSDNLSQNTGTKTQVAFPWDEPPRVLSTLGEGYVLLTGLLRQLPPERQWSKTHREQWLTAFTAMLDLMIKVVDLKGQPQLEDDPAVDIVTQSTH